MDQKIIDLYDEYTHAPLARRVFLNRLAAMVGGMAAATALVPLLEANQAHAAINYSSSHPHGNGKTGTVGFCWGGGMANELAAQAPDLMAAVAYYGRQPKAADVSRIKAPLLHYGGLDARINAGIPEFEAALKQAGKHYELYMYEGVNHAFNNDTSEARHNKQAAELAWGRTISFLKTKLV